MSSAGPPMQGLGRHAPLNSPPCSSKGASRARDMGWPYLPVLPQCSNQLITIGSPSPADAVCEMEITHPNLPREDQADAAKPGEVQPQHCSCRSPKNTDSGNSPWLSLAPLLSSFRVLPQKDVFGAEASVSCKVV